MHNDLLVLLFSQLFIWPHTEHISGLRTENAFLPYYSVQTVSKATIVIPSYLHLSDTGLRARVNFTFVNQMPSDLNSAAWQLTSRVNVTADAEGSREAVFVGGTLKKIVSHYKNWFAPQTCYSFSSLHTVSRGSKNSHQPAISASLIEISCLMAARVFLVSHMSGLNLAATLGYPHWHEMGGGEEKFLWADWTTAKACLDSQAEQTVVPLLQTLFTCWERIQMSHHTFPFLASSMHRIFYQ